MSELYSDMEARSREKRYPVHRVIVCPQSAWFEAACGENFKVSFSIAESSLTGGVGLKATGSSW
ncbi:hypothetical protein IF2G_10848 [Cordyceps javanica]|nr:hypothetical protein IF2G_10848 [Cordyceps javanica]